MAVSFMSIILILVTIAFMYGCFVLAGFVARRFEKTSTGILVGGLAGLGAMIALNIIFSIVVLTGTKLASGAY